VGQSSSMNWLSFTTCAGTDLFGCPGSELNKQYNEMKSANCVNCDKYFHCQGNYNAVKECKSTSNAAGIAKKISDCREKAQGSFTADSRADQVANLFGRNGGDCAKKYLCKNNCKWSPKLRTCSKRNCP